MGKDKIHTYYMVGYFLKVLERYKYLPINFYSLIIR